MRDVCVSVKSVPKEGGQLVNGIDFLVWHANSGGYGDFLIAQ